MKNLQSLVKVAAVFGVATATTFSVTQPAKAILVNTFEFTDEDGLGTGRVPGEKVTGTITFDSLNPGDSATGVAADSVIVTEIPDWLDSLVTINEGDEFVTSPFVDNAQYVNNFNIASGTIVDAEFRAWTSTSSADPLLQVCNTSVSICGFDFLGETSPSQFARDEDFSSLTFSVSSSSVPFEFSPSLGLLLMGGVFGMARYAKSRKAIKLIDS
ncbi:exported hypothetical protein [Hyella patelloides LEGE 07179]|uniref:PEP-CTERM sorting domain-containing protein n=1 Tax=Hyella patelloides LEGE 07179 TaxID=945734 RepID=A0A563W486_9CYAN|nr:hypothetical protein [Hyella patelloides]VEP18476.1 exported hypothetical protein [Hyella patelloides LEGE 07179]